jgi:hypothetical protein
MSAVHGLSGDIELNLADVATCSPALLAVIEKEGKEI